MQNNWLSQGLRLGAVIEICLFWTTASAQQESLHPNPAKQVIQPGTSDQAGDAMENMLEKDARLKLRVTTSQEMNTVDQALTDLTIRTRVRLRAEGKELQLARISVRYQAAPLKDILASIARLHDWEWIRQDTGVLLLRSRKNLHMLDVFHPDTEARATVFNNGRELLQRLRHQPAAVADQLQKGVPFSALPPDIQEPIRNLIAADVEDRKAKGGRAFPNVDKLPNATIALQQNDQEGFTNHFVDYNDGQVSALLGFPVFADPEMNYNIIPRSSLTSSAWYADKEDAASRTKALEQDVRLNTKLTLRLRDATLTEALQQLAPLAKINFAAASSGRAPIRKFLAFEEKPLKDILDQLAALYHYTWGEHKSGVFLFHLAPM